MSARQEGAAADKAYCIIGGGVMGEAIGRSLISTGTASASAIIICDIDAKRRSYLESDLGVTVTGEHAEACQAAPVVVLAVKPQDFRTISNSLQGRILPEQLVLSIMAGVNVGTLRNQLGHRALVRVMPNTPAQIGKGMAVWTATPEVNDEQRATVRRILQTLGIELYVPDERYIDMATAVSGSGPGFFFLILEAMIDGAVQIGMRRELAAEMVYQTALGSAAFAQQSKLHTAVLRDQVTSPGGTTAEGIRAMEQQGVRAGIIEAIVAAYERTLELGQEA
ncbi:MAG: pyrroline-5-carboxylate reductase [Chloroflexi bacterium]|nr:pyrroline-5-carboxylate reductase [Chloroflexota bacterium]